MDLHTWSHTESPQWYVAESPLSCVRGELILTERQDIRQFIKFESPLVLLPAGHKPRPLQSPIPSETVIFGTVKLTVPIGFSVCFVWFCADVVAGQCDKVEMAISIKV